MSILMLQTQNLRKELKVNQHFNHRFASCICIHVSFCISGLFWWINVFFHEHSGFIRNYRMGVLVMLPLGYYQPTLHLCRIAYWRVLFACPWLHIQVFNLCVTHRRFLACSYYEFLPWWGSCLLLKGWLN